MMTNLNLVAAGVGLSVVPASMQGTHPSSVAYRPLPKGARLEAPMTLAWRQADDLGPTATLLDVMRQTAQAWQAAAERVRAGSRRASQRKDAAGDLCA
jgi:DNA-binding transcriptional LysR family regulator